MKVAGKEKRRKQAPNFKKGIKASKRWKKANKKESQLKRKVGLARKDWQHKVTSDLSIATSAHVFTDLSDEESRKPSMYRVFQSLTPNT